MGDKNLENILSSTSRLLFDQIEQKKVIFIISNSTVDGIISSSILFDSIYRMGGNAVIRCEDSGSYEESKYKIGNLIKEGQDSFILLDFDSNFYDEIVDLITHDNYFLFINADKDSSKSKNSIENDKVRYLNTYKIKDVLKLDKVPTISSVVYYLIKDIDRKITQMSYLPLIAEISKFPNAVYDRSNEPYNEILQTATSLNLIEKKKDLVFVGKPTSSIISVLEDNTSYFIKGLTWNRQASIRVLQRSGVLFAENKRAKSLDEFEEREINEIINSIEEFVEKENLNDDDTTLASKNLREKLLSYNYILTNEESNSILKGAYSFAKVLESCIKRKSYGLALAISLGDRYDLLSEIRDQIQADKFKIRKSGSKIFSEKWRFYEDGKITFVNGEGILDEKQIIEFADLLAKSHSFSDKIICLRTTGTSSEEMYKYILMSGESIKLDAAKLREKIKEFTEKQGLLIKDCSPTRYHIDRENIDIEAIVPVKKLEVFLSNIKKIIMDVNTP